MLGGSQHRLDSGNEIPVDRGRVALNFHADAFAALAADTARAGHPSPGTYVLARVRARHAFRPVVDAHGAKRVARLKTQLAAAQREVDEAQQEVAARRARRTRAAGGSWKANWPPARPRPGSRNCSPPPWPGPWPNSWCPRPRRRPRRMRTA